MFDPPSPGILNRGAQICTCGVLCEWQHSTTRRFVPFGLQSRKYFRIIFLCYWVLGKRRGYVTIGRTMRIPRNFGTKERRTYNCRRLFFSVNLNTLYSNLCWWRHQSRVALPFNGPNVFLWLSFISGTVGLYKNMENVSGTYVGFNGTPTPPDVSGHYKDFFFHFTILIYYGRIKFLNHKTSILVINVLYGPNEKRR